MSRPVGESSVVLDSPAGQLDALLLNPPAARAQCVLAHGAGAGIQHTNMQAIAAAFATAGVTSLRFNFPYMQAGKRRVDAKPVAVASIVSAAQYLQRGSDLPLLLAGHSFGGRMCTHALVDEPLECAGMVCCSFPLHAAKKPGTDRAAHLRAIRQPVLFLSGTRDDLAAPELLTEVAAGMPNARIHWLETANHSYVVLKRTRTNPLTVFAEIAAEVESFVDELS